MPDMMHTPSSGQTQPGFRTVALIIASAMFMEHLDATILTTALPTMAQSFNVSPEHMSIALTSYLLSLAILIPASGHVADRFGARSVFTSAIVIFLLGSILCAQATTLPGLVAARVVQGAGGALMMPVGRLVLLKMVAKKDLVAAMGWLLVPALTGPMLGPPVGGFIATYLDWRWIFYINIPVGIIGVVVTLRFIPDLRETEHPPFDTTGFILSGLCLACLLFSFEMASRGNGSQTTMALPALLIGLANGAAYILHARRKRTSPPILDLSLLAIPTFRISLIAGSLTRITQGAQPFLLPLMMQSGFGMSAAQSGLLVFATAGGAMLMKLCAPPILKLFGFRTTLIWNSVFSSLLYASCALFRPDWPHAVIFTVLLICGFSMSLQFTAYNTIAYEGIPVERTSSANSFYTTFQQLMLSFGICAGATALAVSSWISGHTPASPADYSAAFIIVTAISLLSAPIAAGLSRDAGQAMSGHKFRRRL